MRSDILLANEVLVCGEGLNDSLGDCACLGNILGNVVLPVVNVSVTMKTTAKDSEKHLQLLVLLLELGVELGGGLSSGRGLRLLDGDALDSTCELEDLVLDLSDLESFS